MSVKKYESVVNINGLSKKFGYIPHDVLEELLAVPCQVTEKIDGENFRIGIVDGKKFIGQRNNIFYNFEEHPNWFKITDETKEGFEQIFAFMELGGEVSEYIFFGELCGNGLQGRFKFPWDGLTVKYFDIFMNGEFLLPSDTYDIIESLRFAYPVIEHVPVFETHMIFSEALKLNVETVHSVASSEDFIEGVVVKPNVDVSEMWKVHGRCAIKLKSAKFAESKTKKHSKSNGGTFVSVFTDHVTEERIHHALQRLTEAGVEIKNEMEDMRYLVPSVIQDIEAEENEGNKLETPDRKAVSKEIGKVYNDMLYAIIKDILG